MKAAFFPLWLICASASPMMSNAAVRPYVGVIDTHIRTVAYDSDQVISLTGYLGYQTMIQFEPSERIENVAIGDALGWQVTPNHKANLLFLKPMDLSAPTNMTVVTDRRQYEFELRSRRVDPAHQAQIAFVLRFAYRPTSAPPLVAAPTPPKPPERRNTAYTYTGSRASLPSQVFDDGQFTYFQWPENTSTPALFLVEADGSESIVNYSVRDGYQVVEQTAPRFTLRNGKEVTVVINEGWRPPTAGALAPLPHDAKTAREAARSGVRP